MMKCVIWVEGIADQKFLADIISEWYGVSFKQTSSKDGDVRFEYSTDVDSLKIQTVEGAGNVTSSDSFDKKLKQLFELNEKQQITNIVILDADSNIQSRIGEINKTKSVSGMNFPYFLVPNNQENGDLETLLQQITNPANQAIFDCWKGYEACLKNKGGYTLPARKTMVYAYLEALLKDSKSQKELIKEGKRNYQNKDHWDLNPENDPLKPLKAFFDQHLLEE